MRTAYFVIALPRTGGNAVANAFNVPGVLSLPEGFLLSTNMETGEIVVDQHGTKEMVLEGEEDIVMFDSRLVLCSTGYVGTTDALQVMTTYLEMFGFQRFKYIILYPYWAHKSVRDMKEILGEMYRPWIMNFILNCHDSVRNRIEEGERNNFYYIDPHRDTDDCMDRLCGDLGVDKYKGLIEYRLRTLKVGYKRELIVECMENCA